MNENKSLVSVIVPIYNAGKYLGEAIESVLNQTYTDFELLLINDRSTDNSKEICEKYAAGDNRIVLLENNTEKHGPGPTRNIGLDNATGEYIYFMDADDWAESELLEEAVNTIKTDGSDMVVFGSVNEFYGEQRTSQRSHRFEKSIWTKEDIKNNIKEYWKVRSITLWSHLIRRSIIGDIRFEEIGLSEDDCFFFDILSVIGSISYLNKWMYHYRILLDSTSNIWHKDYLSYQQTKWIHEKKFMDTISESITQTEYADFLMMDYLRIVYELSLPKCQLKFGEKCDILNKAKSYLELEQYRDNISISDKTGMNKVKYILVKCRLERVLLLLGPLFLRIVRGG